MPKLVYDLSLKRPACAILQIAYGGDLGIAAGFPTEHWLLAPYADMNVYQISTEELAKVIQYHRMLVVGVTVPEGKNEGL
jgi:hypothetical protein